jgi:hypothetical protein
MVTDAEIQAILDQNEPGVDSAYVAYQQAAGAYFSAAQSPQPQIVVTSSTTSR